MNFIKKYKIYKIEKQPIKIVLNSNFDYKDHDLNILKACLNVWSSDDSKYTPLRFDWMFINPEQKEKIYFISTNLRELKHFKLQNIANKLDILSNAYMPMNFTNIVFSEQETLLK